MSHYVPTIPTQTNPVVDSTAFHTPYVRDEASLALDAHHDVMTANDRARVQELARYEALTANRHSKLAEQNAINTSLDEQITTQKGRVAAAVTGAYTTRGPFLANPPSADHRAIYYSTGMGL